MRLTNAYAWRRTNFGRLRKVPPLEAAHWREPIVSRAWTTAEVDQLLDLIDQGHGYAVIAERMGRTRSQVIRKCKRLGVCITRSPTHLSGGQVIALLGLANIKVVSGWIRCGWLPATNAATVERPYWRIQWDDLTAFMEGRREAWIVWHPDRITDPDLRAWAHEVRAGPHRWLTTREVATRLHVNPNMVNIWIRRRLLSAVLHDKWWVWSGDLDTFTIPSMRAVPRWRRVAALLSDTPQTAAQLAAAVGARPKAVANDLYRMRDWGIARQCETGSGPAWII